MFGLPIGGRRTQLSVRQYWRRRLRWQKEKPSPFGRLLLNGHLVLVIALLRYLCLKGAGLGWKVDGAFRHSVTWFTRPIQPYEASNRRRTHCPNFYCFAVCLVHGSLPDTIYTLVVWLHRRPIRSIQHHGCSTLGLGADKTLFSSPSLSIFLLNLTGHHLLSETTCKTRLTFAFRIVPEAHRSFSRYPPSASASTSHLHVPVAPHSHNTPWFSAVALSIGPGPANYCLQSMQEVHSSQSISTNSSPSHARQLSAMKKTQRSKVPDRRQNAGPAGAADGTHDRPKRHEAAQELRENVNANVAVDVPKPQPAESSTEAGSAGQQHSATENEDKTLAHRAALRRLNGTKSAKPTPSDTASTASTQPVLVRAYPSTSPNSPTTNPEMRRSQRQPSLPPLSSFSFQDILKEIDPEINPSIDAIAEIFGRSKLSLADEYSSHLPPQGELSFPASQGQNEVLEAIPNARLEPVEETPPGHTRRQSLALVGTGASAQPKSHAVAATSTASVEPTAGPPPQGADGSADTKASLLPYVLSWLRSSNARSETRSRRSSVDPRAVETLQKILGES